MTLIVPMRTNSNESNRIDAIRFDSFSLDVLCMYVLKCNMYNVMNVNQLGEEDLLQHLVVVDHSLYREKKK